MIELSPNCFYQVRISSMPAYYRDNLMVKCKVRAGLCGTNAMNINQLRSAADPPAEVFAATDQSLTGEGQPYLKYPKVANNMCHGHTPLTMNPRFGVIYFKATFV